MYSTAKFQTPVRGLNVPFTSKEEPPGAPFANEPPFLLGVEEGEARTRDTQEEARRPVRPKLGSIRGDVGARGGGGGGDRRSSG